MRILKKVSDLSKRAFIPAKAGIPFVLLLLSLPFPAHADEAPKTWTVDYPHSHLTFDATQNGNAIHGGFRIFNAAIKLDPNHPDTGSIIVTVDTGSAFAGSADRDAMLPDKVWFDTKAFPQAQFTSTSIRKLGPWRFQADGNLTIKGISHPVTLPFTLAPEGDHWRATGSVNLMRNDFSVGTGEFAGETYVKNAITVNVDMAAN